MSTEHTNPQELTELILDLCSKFQAAGTDPVTIAAAVLGSASVIYISMGISRGGFVTISGGIYDATDKMMEATSEH